MKHEYNVSALQSPFIREPQTLPVPGRVSLHDFIDGGGGTVDVVCRAGLDDAERLEFKSIAGSVVICSGEDVYLIGRAVLWERKVVFVVIDVLSGVVEVMFGGVNVAFVREVVKFRSVDVMFCGRVRATNGM